MNTMKQPQKLILFRFLPALIVVSFLFQNCILSNSFKFESLNTFATKSQESNAQENQPTTDGGGGNGYGYEGKPEGSFLRTVPGINCPQQILSKINIQLNDNHSKEPSFTIETLENKDTCKYNKSILSEKDIQFSDATKDLIVYKDGLYNLDHTKTYDSLNTVAIAWCVDVNKKSEIILYNDQTFLKSDSQPYLTKTKGKHSFQSNTQQILHFQLQSVASRTGEQEVVSTDNFQLDIFGNLTLANSNGTFAGQLSSKDSSQLSYICYLGQKFDGYIWPSNQLLANNIQSSLKLNSVTNLAGQNNLSGLLFTQLLENPYPQEMKFYDFQTHQIQSIFKSNTPNSIDSFQYLADKNAVIFEQKNKNTLLSQQIIMDISNYPNLSHWVSTPLIHSDLPLTEYFSSPAIPNKIFFTESPYQLLEQDRHLIGTYDLSTGIKTLIDPKAIANSGNPSLNITSIPYYHYRLLNNQNEIAFSDLYGGLFTYHLLTQIVQPVLTPDDTQVAQQGYKSIVASHDSYLVIKNYNITNPKDFKFYVLQSINNNWSTIGTIQEPIEMSDIYYQPKLLWTANGLVYIKKSSHDILNNKAQYYGYELRLFNLNSKSDILIYSSSNQCKITHLMPQQMSNGPVLDASIETVSKEIILICTSADNSKTDQITKIIYLNLDHPELTREKTLFLENVFVHQIKFLPKSERLFFIAERPGRPKELYLFESSTGQLRIISNRFFALGDVENFETNEYGTEVSFLTTGWNFYLKSLYLWVDQNF